MKTIFKNAVLGVLASLVAALPMVAEAAKTDTIFLLHGYNSQGNSSGQGDAWDCRAIWQNQRNLLATYGHTGRTQTIGYYSDNKNCDRNLASTVYTKNFLGDPSGPRQGGPANFSVLTFDTSLTHVAYRFAWAAAREKNDSGRPIQVITDSLGGLVVRQAIAMSSMGNSDFPTLAQMNIIGVHAYGSPFYGTPVGALGGTIQAVQARTGSDFISTLNSPNYTRVGSASWYSFTSNVNFTNGDGLISDTSACWLRSVQCIRYVNPAYFHGSYKDDPNYTVLKQGAYYNRFNPATQGWSPRPSFNDYGAAAVVAGTVIVL